MPLPEKDYFLLKEIAGRWGVPMERIEHYATEAKLVLSVRVLADVVVEVGQDVPHPDGTHIPKSERRLRVLRTVQGLLPENLDVIFRDGVAVVDRFQPEAGEDWREIDQKSPITSITVSRHELVITQTERNRFEQTHGIEPSMQGQPVEDERHVEPERHLSRKRGRPNIMSPIMQEFHRRASANECKPKVTAEARVLLEWSKKERPNAPLPELKTVLNSIGPDYDTLVRKTPNIK